MATTTLHEVNGAVTMTLPEEYAHANHLGEGSSIETSFHGQELTARPTGKSYSLEQLIREHAEIISELEDNSEWVNAPRVGREII